VIRVRSEAIRRVGACAISFTVSARIPASSTPCRAATIPITVIMHVPSAVATRSVGENASPLPWLSTGASVSTVAPEGPCSARQRSPPS